MATEAERSGGLEAVAVTPRSVPLSAAPPVVRREGALVRNTRTVLMVWGR